MSYAVCLYGCRALGVEQYEGMLLLLTSGLQGMDGENKMLVLLNLEELEIYASVSVVLLL